MYYSQIIIIDNISVSELNTFAHSLVSISSTMM